MRNEPPSDETPPMRCRRCDAVLKQGRLICDACGFDHRASQIFAGEGMFAGDLVGAYELIEELGDGGFGVVWRARQGAPLKREVALKLIKPGMNSGEVIQRFESERERLAMMVHPNIASVFDAGTTPSGRPYFVMELVQGKHLTTYCDEHKLSIRERLKLFTAVCHGVQHAHHKGILHRDLKPSNIMVAEVDGQPVPKIIDFGVAKALEAQASNPLLTHPDVVIGTRCYMSPEQAANEKDVDTRSDVYALGVVLYELLTGHLPLTVEQLQEAAWQEARRIICDVDPPKPSSRAQSATQQIATSRQCEPKTLEETLKNDLDWVALMALEKNRERRYSSPTELAQDVQRYLDNQAVIAAPKTWHYQLRKFASRHRVAFAIGSLASFALALAAIAGIFWVGKRGVEAKADELNKSLDHKRAELTASQHSYYWERAQSEQDQGSPRRAIAWLTQALRTQSDDHVSLDALTYLLADHEWVVPLERIPFSTGMLTPNETLGESGVFEAQLEATPGDVRAWVLDWNGAVTRSFRWRATDQKWQHDFTASTPFDTSIEVPETASEKEEARKKLRLQRPLERRPAEDWMIKLDGKDGSLVRDPEVLYAPGREWAFIGGPVERFAAPGLELVSLFNVKRRTKTDLRPRLDEGDPFFEVCPLFLRDRPWMCLVHTVERVVELYDLEKPDKPLDYASWRDPEVDDEYETEGGYEEDKKLSGRMKPTLTRAALSSSGNAIIASYKQAIDSREQFILWKLDRSASEERLERFGGRGAYLPLPVCDVRLPDATHGPGRVLVVGNDSFFISLHTGFGSPKTREAGPAFIAIDYDEEGQLTAGIKAKCPANGNIVREVENESFVVESPDGDVLSRFRVQCEPGGGGWSYERFGFSPDGRWVLARGESDALGDLRTEIFDAATGRRVFPIIKNGVEGLTADGKMGKMASDSEKPLRTVSGKAPAWFLDFIDAIVCCRIEGGTAVDTPPETLSELRQHHAQEMQKPESKPFAEYIEQRFGRE